MNLYKFNLYDKEYNIYLDTDSYSLTKNLAVRAYSENGEPFATITVNLPDGRLSGDIKKFAFVDTNNIPGIDSFLISNGIAKPTGHYGFSGFCAYPEFEFDLEKLS